MPAYSYKERFVPLILDKSKTQTIRKRRKKGFAKPGDTLYHYFGLRTKYCRKLGESLCKNVKTIVIKENGSIILYDNRLTDQEVEKALRGNLMGIKLSDGDLVKLARDDGFRIEQTGGGYSSYDLMMKWWKQTHDLPFVGDLILWDKKTFVKTPATGNGK